MPVVQRMQRLQLLLAEAGRAQPHSYVRAETMFRGRVRSAELLGSGALMAADALAFLIASMVAGLAGVASGNAESAEIAAQPQDFLPLVVCIGAGMVGYLTFHRSYDHRMPVGVECRNIVVATLAALVLAAACAFLVGLPLPRVPLIGTACLFPLSAMALRRLARSGLDAAGLWRVPVLVVGDGEWAGRAASSLQAQGDMGFDVVARIPAPSPGSGAPNWSRLMRQHRARLLVLATGAGGRIPPEIMPALVRERIPYAVFPQADGSPAVGMESVPLSTDYVLRSYRNNLGRPIARAAKLTFDVALSSAALAFAAPVMLAIAALVGLDGGPVFYAHRRVGARGRVFDCLKFRSMVIDGDAALQRVLAADPAAAEEWARTHKLRCDPRVTWIGRLLRKTSLDELPQLLNVLRLEMSLVGPRPIVSLEIPKYGEDIAYYYETRPGITGLWQVSGRSDTTYDERVRLDSWYVKNWTFWQDLSILARTIPAVVSGRGAG